MAFAGKGTLTVTSNSSLLPSTQTNFPVLVSFTDPLLKTAGNGGLNQNASGFDNRFFSDTGLSASLDFELEFFDATAGTILAWVRLPTCALGTVFYIGFGDAALNTNASSTSTWDSNFKAVYHFPGSLGLGDSTANGNTLTNSASPATATTGKINGGAALLSSGPQYLYRDSFSLGATNVTASAWFNSNNLTDAMFVEKEPVNGDWELFRAGGGTLTLRGGSTTAVTGSAPVVNTWHHIVGTISGTTGTIYLNGASVGSGAVTAIANTTNTLNIGRYTGGFYLNGSIDEVRVSAVARAADWITAEYNNQADPTTFIGAVFAAAQSVIPPIMNSYRQQRAA